MKKCPWFALNLLCCWSLVASDANTSGTEDFDASNCFVLTLSNDQLTEVESLRRVTLDSDQLSQLRSLAPNFPKRIGVASPFVKQISDSRFSLWPDQAVGIWFQEHKIAIARNTLDGNEGWREFSKELNSGGAILIDTKGTYAIGPRDISSEKLAKKLERLGRKEPDGTSFFIFILRPPILDDANAEQAVESSINNLTRLCQANGIGYRIGG